jgi:hypothetical protein
MLSELTIGPLNTIGGSAGVGLQPTDASMLGATITERLRARRPH